MLMLLSPRFHPLSKYMRRFEIRPADKNITLFGRKSLSHNSADNQCVMLFFRGENITKISHGYHSSSCPIRSHLFPDCFRIFPFPEIAVLLPELSGLLES